MTAQSESIPETRRSGPLPASNYVSKTFGRPSIYTDELASEICERVAEGELLIDILDDPHMPAKSTVFRWLDTREDFRDCYARARRGQAHIFADQLIKRGLDESRDYQIVRKTRTLKDGTIVTEETKVSDNTAVQRDKLSTGNMMWLMEKIHDGYASRTQLNVNGAIAIAPAFNVSVTQSSAPTIASERPAIETTCSTEPAQQDKTVTIENQNSNNQTPAVQAHPAPEHKTKNRRVKP